MMWKLAGLAGAALLTACAPASMPTASTSPGLVIVTVGGVALDTTTQTVPSTLDLGVVAARSLPPSQVSITLDGRAVAANAAPAGAVTASVSALVLSSRHLLVVRVDGETAFSGAITVISTTAAMAAVHRDGNGSSLDADIDFSNPPSQSAVAAVLPGATLTWSDQDAVHAVWPLLSAPTSLELPESLAMQWGSRLAAPLSLDLSAPAAGQLRRVTEPSAPTPVVSTLVGFAVSTAASHASVASHVSQLTVLSPTGWEVLGSGSLSGVPDSVDVAAAQAAGDSLMPVVANDDDSAAETHTLVTSSASQTALAAALVAGCEAQDFAGINLDIESIDPGDRDGFTTTVQVLASALHSHHLRLTVDVVPAKPNDLNFYSAAYNVPAIAAVADSVVLMAYDEHDANTGAGPEAGLDWDTELLAGSGSGVPPAKLVLGMPLYAGCWDGMAATTGGYAPSLAVALAAPGASVGYDFAAQTPYISYVGSDGNDSICYFDDSQSLACKMALAHTAGLGGVAVWRLGFEDPAFWSLIGDGGRS